MKLLVIRHAISENRVTWTERGKDDDLRPLTSKGRKRMRRAARGLKTVVPRIDLLATSPLVRAVQTAEIVANLYKKTEVREVAELIPAHHPSAFFAWLRVQEVNELVAAVGHEPQLGQLASWLVSGQERSFIELKKGAACLLEWEEEEIVAGRARLRWLLAPKHLRRLRR